MAIVLKDQSAGGRLGEALGGALAQAGAGLGKGFGSGLDALANMKMQDYMMRQQAALQNQMKQQQAEQKTQIYEEAGIPKPLAAIFAHSEPSEVRAWLDRLEGLNIPLGAQQQTGLQQLLAPQGQQSQTQQPLQGTELAEPFKLEPAGEQQAPQTGLRLGAGSQERRHREMLAEQKRKSDIAEKRFEKEYGLKEKKEEARAEEKERAQTFAEQKTVQPFLKRSAEDYQAHKKAAHVAEEMKKILLAKHKQFPGMFTANAPEFLQEILIRDKDVRNYMSKLNELVKLKAGTTKGNVTNYKIQLEKLAKVKMNQPLQTQLELLDWVINDYDLEKDKQKFIAASKDKKGRYPLDIEQKYIEYDLAQEDPLKYPQYFEEGTIYEDDNGAKHILKNRNWEDL